MVGIITRAKRQQHIAQPQQIAIVQRSGLVGRQALLVEVGPIDAVKVFDPAAALLQLQAGVTA